MSDFSLDTSLTNIIPLGKALLGIVDEDDEILKAAVASEAGGPESQAQEQIDEMSVDFMRASNILIPPYDPNTLALVAENSSTLRPNIDAYIINVDGYGHSFKPVIDLDAEDSDTKIKDALRYDSKTEPTDAQVTSTKKQLWKDIADERQLLTAFFENCAYDMQFSGPEGLRGLTRMDLETTGNAYWEVYRDLLGNVAAFGRLPSRSMKMSVLDPERVDVLEKRKKSLLTVEEVPLQKRFRRFVQRYEKSTTVAYFKEFGDPRTISSKTGKSYKSEEALNKAEPDAPVATEVIHFKISSSRTEYGIPRWIGVLLAVLGTRQAEEVNFMYFENKSIPPLAVLVNGGRLSTDTVKRLEDYIKGSIKGKKNFHNVLILEADSAQVGAFNVTSGDTDPGKMRITLQPLTDAQQKDGLFMQYCEANMDKVGMTFRLPRLLRGDVRDFNRSCYSEDTETLTETGWKLHQDIGPEERIAAYTPETGEITYVVPQQKLVYDLQDEELIRFSNRKTDCFVTPEHTMLVRSAGKKDQNGWEVRKAGEVSYERFKVPVAGSMWNGTERTEPFSLPKVCKIERGHHHDTNVNFDDWLEFLGYFISEGGLVRTNHPSAAYLVYIDQKKPAVRERIRRCLDRLGWTYSTQLKSCGTTHFLLSNRCLRDWILKNLGNNSHDWHLPAEYLHLSHRQIRILFEAMMDGDGSVGRVSTNAVYYSASKTLVDQVQIMALQLSFKAHVRRSEEAGVWRVLFSEGTETQLQATPADSRPAGVQKIRYTGKVYCFSVPGYGFFVTRRNGKPAIQGNTAQAALDFAEVQVFNPLRQQFDWVMNRLILTVLSARYHEFVSNAATITDPELLSAMIKDLMEANALTPEEGRELAEQVFHRTFLKIDAPWTKQPVGITVSGANALLSENGKGKQGEGAGAFSVSGAGPTQAASGVGRTGKAEAIAKSIETLHRLMIEGERQEIEKMEEEIIKVPADIFYGFFAEK